jgi:hypothetical protein
MLVDMRGFIALMLLNPLLLHFAKVYRSGQITSTVVDRWVGKLEICGT